MSATTRIPPEPGREFPCPGCRGQARREADGGYTCLGDGARYTAAELEVALRGEVLVNQIVAGVPVEQVWDAATKGGVR